MAQLSGRVSRDRRLQTHQGPAVGVCDDMRMTARRVFAGQWAHRAMVGIAGSFAGGLRICKGCVAQCEQRDARSDQDSHGGENRILSCEWVTTSVGRITW